jgi:pimeloyl-ACP methyl ester carboxylesterase
MNSLTFTTQTVADGIVEREFTIGDVTGVLWTPPDNAPTPVVLLGHGGGNHCKHPAMAGRARLLVLDAGFSAVAINAPGHGDRPRTEHDEQEIAEMFANRAAGGAEGPIVERYNANLAERALPEWLATLDALLELPEIGGPVGYFGLNMGTAIGVPLVAVEPRIVAAVFGLFWPGSLAETAKRITIPIEFAMQWDDEHIAREQALELFDAFASTEKTLHANSGKHKELPRFESVDAVRFFQRHLTV